MHELRDLFVDVHSVCYTSMNTAAIGMNLILNHMLCVHFLHPMTAEINSTKSLFQVKLLKILLSLCFFFFFLLL